MSVSKLSEDDFRLIESTLLFQNPFQPQQIAEYLKFKLHFPACPSMTLSQRELAALREECQERFEDYKLSLADALGGW